MDPTHADRHSARADWWWILDPRLSLRARAAVLCGGAALLFTTAAVWFTGHLLELRTEERVGENFETLAFQLGDKLDRATYERYRELQLTAALAPLRTSTAPAADRRAVLDSLQVVSPDFAWIGFADPSGAIVAATQRQFEGTSAATQTWFRGAQEQSYVGPLRDVPQLPRADSEIDDESLPRRFLDLALPVTGENGQAVGVLAAQVRWGGWARETQLSVVPESARSAHIGVTIYDSAGELLLDSGGSGLNMPPEAPAIAPARGSRGAMRETTAGMTFLTGYARSRGYRDYRGQAWLITVRQPLADVFAPVRTVRNVLVALGVIVTLIVGVVSWVGGGRIAQRLRSITAAARRIRQGDVLTVMPQPHGRSEIDDACGAVSDLVEHFRAREQELAPAPLSSEPHLRSRPPATDQIHRMI